MATAARPTARDAWAEKLRAEQMVAERQEQLVVEAGHSKEDADGNDVADYVSFKAKGSVELAACRIDDADDMSKGFTKEELLEKILGEDVEYDLDDPIDREAISKLAKRAGGLMDPDPKGPVQRALPKGLVLIKTPTYRSSGRVWVAFVTTDPQLIMDYGFQPVIDQAIKQAVKVHDKGLLIVDRKPELAGPVQKAIESGATRARNTARIDLAELEAGDESK
jgi:hypothetical protein